MYFICCVSSCTLKILSSAFKLFAKTKETGVLRKMALARAIQFTEAATLNLLKMKLEELGLNSTGQKATLKARLLEEINRRGDDQLEAFFPENLHAAAAGEVPSPEAEHVDEGNRGQIADDEIDEELVRLRQRLRKEREIAELRQQIATLSNTDYENSSTRTASVFNFKDVEESLPQFSGDDDYSVKKWIDTFEETAYVLKWDDRTCLVYAKRLLVGTAKLFLRSNSCKSWEDLKQALTKEFSKKITSAEVHVKLRNRKKQKTESVLHYVLTMQEIASLANIEEADLIYYIIDGIPGPDQHKMLLYNANSLGELKLALQKFERLTVQTSKYQDCGLNHNPTKEPNHNSEIKKVRPSSRKIKCFNCNGYGHLSKSCTRTKRAPGSCFRCGKTDHQIKDCGEKAVMTLSNSTSPEVRDNYDDNQADCQPQDDLLE